jgi:nitrate/nitrite transporter NarK
MFAILPLLGGLIAGRIAPRRLAIALQVAFYVLAAAVIIATSPQHHASHTSGVILSLVLAPLSAATLLGGMTWQRHTRPA